MVQSATTNQPVAAERIALETGPPLGVVESVDYEALSISLSPGDSLTLTTDGIDEACNEQGELYGLARVSRQIAASDGTPEDTGKKLLRDLREFIGGKSQNDDVCIVCIGRSDRSN